MEGLGVGEVVERVEGTEIIEVVEGCKGQRA